MSRWRRAAVHAAIAMMVSAGPLFGAESGAPAPEASGVVVGALGHGPETNLPLPRYVSLKSSRANIRRGPGLSYRADWVFLRRGMPLKVIAEHGHWRKIADVDGATGWIHHALLRGGRSAVVVTSPRAALRVSPDQSSARAAMVETGVIVSLESCATLWCAVKKDGHDGWLMKSEIWGADANEIFE